MWYHEWFAIALFKGLVVLIQRLPSSEKIIRFKASGAADTRNFKNVHLNTRHLVVLLLGQKK